MCFIALTLGIDKSLQKLLDEDPGLMVDVILVSAKKLVRERHRQLVRGRGQWKEIRPPHAIRVVLFL